MANGAVARRSPTCSAIMVPWLNPTSASADAGRLRRLSSPSRNVSSTGAALLQPSHRSLGSRKVSARFDGAIIVPEQMRRHSAPRAPRLGELDHLLGGRPPLEVESEPRRLLQGEVAGGPGVGVPETEQKIDVGGPWTDAVQCG